jgi:hypothetical protein
MARFKPVAILMSCSALGVLACDPSAQVPLGQSPRTLSVGDVNGDGHADLVVTSLNEPPDSDPVGPSEPEQILVRLGAGDGTFGDVRRSAGPVSPQATFFADLNGDPYPDLVATRSFGGAESYTSDGDGTFTGSNATVPGDARSPGGAAGDFNGDGRTDLAVLVRDEGNTYMNVSFGNADGSMTFVRSYGLLPVRVVPSAVAAGDLNGDGKLDLVVTGSHAEQAGAIPHLNDGTGTFVPRPVVAASVAAVALADVDGDGKLDAVTGGASIELLRGTGDGGFAAAQTLFTPQGETITDLAVADVNGDNRGDIVATAASGLHVLTSSGSTYSHGLLATGANPKDVALVDVNGDGQKDAVNLNQTSPGSVTIHYNAALRAAGTPVDAKANGDVATARPMALGIDGRPRSAAIGELQPVGVH